MKQILISDNKVEVSDGELFVRYFIDPVPYPFTVPARSLKAFLSALDNPSLEIGSDDLLTTLVSPRNLIAFTKFDYPFPDLSARFNLSVVSNLQEIKVSPSDMIDAVRAVSESPESIVFLSGKELNLQAVTLTCSDYTTGYSGTSSLSCLTTAGDFTASVNSGKLIKMLSSVRDSVEVSLMLGDSSISVKTHAAQAFLLRRS